MEKIVHELRYVGYARHLTNKINNNLLYESNARVN